MCGVGLYGNISKKKSRNKEGEYYKHYFYYAYKHRLKMSRLKCIFSKQLKMETVNREVLTIISKIVGGPSFAVKLQEKISIQVDTSEIDKQLERYQSQKRKFLATKTSLITQIDDLDFEDRIYKQKNQDLNERLNTIYDRLEEVETLILESETRRNLILEGKMTADNVYKVLLNLDSLLAVMKRSTRSDYANYYLKK